MNECGIYTITNSVTGDFYVGSSCNIERRLYNHRWKLSNNRHGNRHLQNSWNKHGGDNFEFTAILLCDKSMTLYCEQELLDLLKPSYNTATRAEAPGQGLTRTEESKCKNSEAHKGNTNVRGHKLTEEHKRKIGEAQKGELNHMFGKHHTEEHKLKISAAMKGKRKSAEARAAMKGNTNSLGYKQTEEHKQNISEGLNAFHKAQRELQLAEAKNE